jgi:hypothetical protein
MMNTLGGPKDGSATQRTASKNREVVQGTTGRSNSKTALGVRGVGNPDPAKTTTPAKPELTKATVKPKDPAETARNGRSTPLKQAVTARPGATRPGTSMGTEPAKPSSEVVKRSAYTTNPLNKSATSLNTTMTSQPTSVTSLDQKRLENSIA